MRAGKTAALAVIAAVLLAWGCGLPRPGAGDPDAAAGADPAPEMTIAPPADLETDRVAGADGPDARDGADEGTAPDGPGPDLVLTPDVPPATDCTLIDLTDVASVPLIQGAFEPAGQGGVLPSDRWTAAAALYDAGFLAVKGEAQAVLELVATGESSGFARVRLSGTLETLGSFDMSGAGPYSANGNVFSLMQACDDQSPPFSSAEYSVNDSNLTFWFQVRVFGVQASVTATFVPR